MIRGLFSSLGARAAIIGCVAALTVIGTLSAALWLSQRHSERQAADIAVLERSLEAAMEGHGRAVDELGAAEGYRDVEHARCVEALDEAAERHAREIRACEEREIMYDCPTLDINHCPVRERLGADWLRRAIGERRDP